MKPKPWVFFALIVGLLIVCGPVFAHHGAASYVKAHCPEGGDGNQVPVE